jgi:hypothetical protein
VSLLLALANTSDIPAHVITVMRTEALGDCDDVPGLAERLNQSALLVPRLSQSQLVEVIEGPARREELPVSPQLTEALLRSMGERGDLLPMLQHALHRTWQEWADHGRRQGDLDVVHLERIGGLSQAFTLEADALLDGSRVVPVVIELPADDWEALRRDARSPAGLFTANPPKKFTWHRGHATVDGVAIVDAGIRKKGFFGSLDSARPSLIVDFNRYVPQQPIDGIGRLTLNNNKQDNNLTYKILLISYKIKRHKC